MVKRIQSFYQFILRCHHEEETRCRFSPTPVCFWRKVLNASLKFGAQIDLKQTKLPLIFYTIPVLASRSFVLCESICQLGLSPRAFSSIRSAFCDQTLFCFSSSVFSFFSSSRARRGVSCRWRWCQIYIYIYIYISSNNPPHGSHVRRYIEMSHDEKQFNIREIGRDVYSEAMKRNMRHRARHNELGNETERNTMNRHLRHKVRHGESR